MRYYYFSCTSHRRKKIGALINHLRWYLWILFSSSACGKCPTCFKPVGGGPIEVDELYTQVEFLEFGKPPSGCACDWVYFYPFHHSTKSITLGKICCFSKIYIQRNFHQTFQNVYITLKQNKNISVGSITITGYNSWSSSWSTPKVFPLLAKTKTLK